MGLSIGVNGGDDGYVRPRQELVDLPRVTLCIDEKTPPYRAVVLYGQARMTVGTDDERVRRFALAYLGPKAGTAYADSLRGERLVIVRVRPERIISWDYGKADNP